MSTPASYSMGYTDHERRRLALQDSILRPLTHEFLRRAGLEPGMRVLDLGCGTGGVTFIAAALVGPQGHVTGLDRDEQALAVARASSEKAGLTNVSFEAQPIVEHSPDRPYDAIIGRLFLVHTPDPSLIVQQAVAQVRPGGIVAFQEYDLSHHYPNAPAKPLFERSFGLITQFFTRVTQADIGLRLLSMFREAGLVQVQSRGEFLLDGGADSPFYEWAADTVRSLLPKLEAFGLVTREELDIDTLRDRFQQEAVSIGGTLASPVLIGTFGVKPAA